MSNVEAKVRERLANNGRNLANNNAGIRVGSDLHLCEMLLKDIEGMRQALTQICFIRPAGEPEGAWRSDLQQIAYKALEANEKA